MIDLLTGALTAPTLAFFVGCAVGYFGSRLTKRVKAPEVAAPVVVRDETKLKSRQPGSQIPTRPSQVLPTEQPERRVERDTRMITEDSTKQRTIQPRGDDLDKVREADENKGRAFTHRFFGSHLIVGTQTLLSGLSVGLHTLEITQGGQLFIDNNPYPINPSDLVRIKAELSKIVR